ncbi:MAG: HEAT repeat domain-containing protein [Chloroflexi bacterium]|nr:HEAT repeat domain-containing protein [Chloroflexota bacterium]
MPNGSEHASRPAKVIDLQGHQAAEQALDLVLTTSPASPQYPLRLAELLGMGPPLLAAIVRHLDAADPHKLDALGRVLSLYPQRPQVVQALMRAGSDRRGTDNRRLGAILVLEHFLGISPPDDFFSALHDPVGIALQTLSGITGDAVPDIPLMHDYLRLLISQPIDLLYSILAVLAELGGVGAIEIVRLIALHPDPELRISAIETLAAQGSPRAIATLCQLEPNLPPDTSRAVSRALQKLRLSGVDVGEAADPGCGCRALLGPIDGHGHRLLWLLAPSVQGKAHQIAHLGLVITDIAGLVEAEGASSADATLFPPLAPLGTLHQPFASRLSDLAEEWSIGEQYFASLEVPFDYGLAMAARAVQRNWETGTLLPVDYLLLYPLFWHHAGKAELPGFNQPPGNGEQDPSLAENESELFLDSLFESWYLETEGVAHVAEEVARAGGGLSHELSDENWRILLPALIRLAHDEFGPHLRTLYAKRLQLMSEWFSIAGEARKADLAASAARTMLQSPPEANLFVLRLAQKGVLVTISNLRF